MATDTSPTARALLALEVLQARPGISATDLARRLGVTERAARRYVAILREAGIPVESTRGRYGGYRLGRGLRLPPLVFTATEALGLVMAGLEGHHAASDSTDPVGAALGKIIRALPEAVGRPAAMLREHAAAVPTRDHRPDPETTKALIAAVAAGRCVEIAYRSASGREFTSAVDPWSVVVRHGLWYLLCRAHRADAIRTYRLERIRSVTPLEATFTPPPDLDPVAVLEENLALGWGLEVRVVVDGTVEEVRPWVRAPMGVLSPDGADRCVLTGSTSNPEMYAGEWLASLPFRFRVEGGPELRAAVAAVAERMAAAVE
jgi:predicted DNA-binding transcriptional regulator YafY